MAYSRAFKAAAKRHLKDAKSLQSDKRFDNAGYHYGLAAECALKGAFIRLGERSILKKETTADAYFAHFPKLRTASLVFQVRTNEYSKSTECYRA